MSPRAEPDPMVEALHNKLHTVGALLQVESSPELFVRCGALLNTPMVAAEIAAHLAPVLRAALREAFYAAVDHGGFSYDAFEAAFLRRLREGSK